MCNPGSFCKMSRTILQLICPLPIRLPKKLMTNYCKFCLYSEQKASNTTEIPRPDAPPPSGPTPLGPHCFWVVVCATCCCWCSLLFVLFLFFVLLCFFCLSCFSCLLGRRPLKNRPLPLLTFQNVNNNKTIDETPLTSENVKNNFCVSPKKHFVSQKDFCISKKSLWSFVSPKKTFVPPKKRIPTHVSICSMTEGDEAESDWSRQTLLNQKANSEKEHFSQGALGQLAS